MNGSHSRVPFVRLVHAFDLDHRADRAGLFRSDFLDAADEILEAQRAVCLQLRSIFECADQTRFSEPLRGR